MRIKLFDSELKVMEVLWRNGPLPAGRIAKILKAETGWNRNTTYTVIKKCIEKGAVMRTEPNFICTASRQQRTSPAAGNTGAHRQDVRRLRRTLSSPHFLAKEIFPANKSINLKN